MPTYTPEDHRRDQAKQQELELARKRRRAESLRVWTAAYSAAMIAWPRCDSDVYCKAAFEAVRRYTLAFGDVGVSPEECPKCKFMDETLEKLRAAGMPK